MNADYKSKFYAQYRTAHTRNLYGEAGRAGMEQQFPYWDVQYERFLPEDKEARMCDVGCGNGGFVAWLETKGYKNAEGIDVSTEEIEQGKRDGVRNIREADLFEFLKSKESYYDVLFLRDVLGHFSKEEIMEVLAVCFSSLKSGGRILLKTPNAESPMSGRLRYGDFTHDVSFTESSLRQVLLVSGFSDVFTYPMRPAVHGVKSFVRAVLWRCIEAILKSYRLIEAGSGHGIFTQNVLATARKHE